MKSVVNNDLFQGPLFSNDNCEINETLFPDVTLHCETNIPAPDFGDSDTEDSFADNLPVAEVNGLIYIAGWTCRKFLKSHACEICREQLVDSKGDLDSSKIFCHFKAEERPESLFGGLTLPSNLCLQHFKEVESIVRSSIEKAMLSNRISQNLMIRLQNHTFVTPLQLCSTQLVSAIHLIYVRLKVFYTLKWRNRRQFTKVYKKNRKLLKLQH